MRRLRQLATSILRPLFRAVPAANVPALLETLSRNQKILQRINKAGQGLEIGPSYRPIAPKKAGYNVQVIDHAPREQLVAKYAPHNVPVENIEEVDFIWHGEPYVELTGRPHFYDWIIASHVIEHTPNFIGFLDNCASILKETGVLSLAVPDLRFCFDHFRPPTTVARIVDAHLQKAVRHTPGTACEYIMSMVAKDDRECWPAGFRGEYKLIHPPGDGPAVLRQVLQETDYVDFHAWCFTPSSFRLLLQDLHMLGFTQFREVAFFPTVNCEFYITLGLQGPLPNFDRLQMLKQIRAELLAAE